MKITERTHLTVTYAPHQRGNEQAQRVMQERQNEAKLREQEDKLIKSLQKRMADVRDTTMDATLKEEKLEHLAEQIEAIYAARIQREQDAAKRDMEAQQEEMEKKQRAQEEKNAAKNATIDRDEALRRADIRSLTQLSLSQEALDTLKRTKAARSAEAARLRQDIENTESPMQIGLDVTVKVKSGHATPNDFRNRHLAALNEGIGRMESAMAVRQRDMMQTMMNWTAQRSDIIDNATAEDEVEEGSEKMAEKEVEKETANETVNETAKEFFLH